MKLVAIGLWVTLVALACAYATAVVLPARAAKKEAAAPQLVYAKTKTMNVPMLADGAVQGFVAVQLGYTVDDGILKGIHVPPEVFLQDEAFRAVYSDPSLDFRNLAKYDLGKLTARIMSGANTHLGAPVIKDVLIEQFSFIGKDAGKG